MAFLNKNTALAIAALVACGTAAATEDYDLRYAPGYGAADMSAPFEGGWVFQAHAYAYSGNMRGTGQPDACLQHHPRAEPGRAGHPGRAHHDHGPHQHPDQRLRPAAAPELHERDHVPGRHARRHGAGAPGQQESNTTVTSGSTDVDGSPLPAGTNAIGAGVDALVNGRHPGSGQRRTRNSNDRASATWRSPRSCAGAPNPPRRCSC